MTLEAPSSKASTITTPTVTTPTVTTPTVRQAGRRLRFWIIVAVIAVVVAVATMIITGAGSPGGTPLAATSAGPAGSMAIAEVLRQQGVTVTATDGLAATSTAARTAANTTIFVVDDGGYLDGQQLKELSRISSHLILMTPSFDQLTDAVPEIAQAGSVTGELTAQGAAQGAAGGAAGGAADCALPAVTNAATVTGDGSGYRLIDTTADAESCLGSGDDIYSLIQLHRGDTLLTVIGTRAAFSNEQVAERGNAALALTLLGASENLLWYLPSIDDAAVPGAPSIGDLTPAWVSAVMALLLLVAIAAAFWRGRRLGPLVVENLPVTVRASETMEGRARLYQKSSARLRALDALRIGTIERLGTRCALPRLASVDEVILAVAAAIGRPPAEVGVLLRDEIPAGDADLVRLSDALQTLERVTATAIRPPTTSPTESTPAGTGRIGQ